jgi:selenocysteine-specific elongation factor
MTTPSNLTNAEPSGTLHFTLATAGHVDHGKTSVLRALTGIDPDRLKEEKERQMTIDLGFAHMRVRQDEIAKSGAAQKQRFEESLGSDLTPTSELVVGFVDVPGHGKFLKNMLAGVGGMDMALIVVAADEGVMPQTVQHVKILTLLGVRECILVINKIDLADADQTELAIGETEEFLERFGIKVLETVPFSCANSETTAALRAAIVKYVLSIPAHDRRHDSSGKLLPSFLSIDRVFSKAGHGAVVTGTLTRGTIKVGDEVHIQPGVIGARVRGLQTFNHKLERALPGQRLAINLALKENKTIERGHAVVGDGSLPVDTLIVQITDLGGLESSNDLEGEGLKPQSVRFYHGTAERYAFLRWIQPLVVEGGDTNGSAKRANLKQPLVGQLVLTEPLIAGPGEKYVLRYGEYGIAGGEILMTARPRWLSRALLKPLAEKIVHGDLEAATLEFINLAPQRSVAVDMIRSVLPDFDRRRVIENLIEKGEIEKLGDRVITRDEKRDLIEKIIAALKQAETKGVHDPSVSQETLRVEVAPLVDRSIFQTIVKDLIASNTVIKVEERLALPSAIAAKASADQSLDDVKSKICEFLDQHFCIEISELAKQIELKEDVVINSLKLLEKDGQAAIVDREFAASAKSLLKAHEVLYVIFQKNRNINPGDFREASGTTRKYAMALLAYFDDRKVTRRMPNGRVLLKAPPK